MREDLKPCPFCGGEDFEWGANIAEEGGGHVKCKKCGVQIIFPQKTLACTLLAGAWNTWDKGLKDKDLFDSLFDKRPHPLEQEMGILQGGVFAILAVIIVLAVFVCRLWLKIC